MTPIYHGTSSKHQKAILQKGITPRGRRKGNWKHAEGMDSISSHVYLTTLYAPYFAFCASGEGNHDLPMIVEVDLDELDADRLYPDEDFIVQCANDVPQGLDMPGRAAYARDNIAGYQHSWELSMEHLGNISFRGTVPPRAVKRLSIIDWDKIKGIGKGAETMLYFALSDPSITVLNKRVLGAKYEALTGLLMGYEPDFPGLLETSYHWYQQVEEMLASGTALENVDPMIAEIYGRAKDQMTVWQSIYDAKPFTIIER